MCFNVEYNYDNRPQEGDFGVVSKDFDTRVEAYDYAARVLARAAERNRNSPLCCGLPEDHFYVDLRIARQDYTGGMPWQVTLLTIFFDGSEEHAMWSSVADGRVYHC